MQAKLSLKNVALVLIGVLLLLAVLFREELAIEGARAYISYTCRNSLHARFAAEKLFFENGELIIEKPRIVTKRPIKDGGFRFAAERMVIRAVPHWLNHELDISVGLQDAAFDLRQATSDMRFWLKDSFQPLPFLTINANLKIDGGVLAIHDFKTEPPTEQKVYFQVEAEGGRHNRGRFVVSLDDPLLKSNSIVLSLARLEKRNIALDMDLDGVEASAFLKAMRNIIPQFDSLQFSEGRIKGKMALTFPKEGRPIAQGDLGFHDIAFTAPDFDLQGRFEEAHLHLTENPNYMGKEESDEVVPRTIGHLEITREGTLVFEGPTQPACAFQHLQGTIYFQTQDGARIAMEGTCRHRSETSRLEINGNAQFASEGRGSLDLAVSLTGADHKPASAHFVTRQLGSKFKFVEINFAKVGPKEFDLLQTLFTPYLAGMHQIEMLEGTIDATALAYMRGLTFTDLKVEKIAAKDMKLRLQPWDVGIAIADLSGELSVNCAASDILDTLNADLIVNDAQIEFTSFDQALCRLHNVQTQFAVRKGVVQKSQLMGEIGGLIGSIEIDGTADEGDILKANFEGSTLGLSHFLPPSMHKGLKTHFAEDYLSIQLSSRPSPLGWLVEGTADIQQPSREEMQKIAFGFDIELCSPQEWLLNLAVGETETPWHELGAAASMAAWAENVSVSGMLQGFFLHEGWCRASHLPLEKYLPLFLPYGDEAKVTGLGDFQGSFDHEGLVMRYGFYDLDIESKAFRITLPEKTEQTAEVMPGLYRLNFATDRWDTSLRIQDGIYLEKNSQLAFQDIATTISCNGETLELSDLETTCEGLHLKGSITVAKAGSKKEVLDIAIHTRELHGQLFQLQALFAHFPRLKFLNKFPLDGQLQLAPEGALLGLAFHPDHLAVEARAKGQLTGGEFALQKDEEGKGIGLRELHLNFDYLQSPESAHLSLTSIDGLLTFNRQGYAEERLFIGGTLCLGDITHAEGEFDVWIKDQQNEILNVKGKSHLNSDQLVELSFDLAKTHFGEIHPATLALSLTGSGQIAAMHLESRQPLAKVLPALQFVARTGIMPAPASWQSKIHALAAAKGETSLKCTYDNRSTSLTWRIAGEDLELNGKQCEWFLLEGKKRDNSWSIDQLVLDDLSLAADLSRQPEGWKVNFLGMRIKEALLLGLEGEYQAGSNVFDSKVNLLELDLGKLSEWPSLREFVSQMRPDGHWRGTGELHLELDPLRIDTVLNGTLRSWNICGLHFHDAPNVSCHYVSGQGLTLRNLSTHIHDNGQELTQLVIEKAAFDFTKRDLTLEGIHFKFAAEKSAQLAEKLQSSFPKSISDNIKNIISNLKVQGEIAGEFHLRTSPGASMLKLSLDEGLYRFQNRNHSIHHLDLSYDLKTLNLFAHYRLGSHSFWMQLFTDDPLYSAGHLLLFDGKPEEQQELLPLKIHWKNDIREGWTIQKAEGTFAGLSMHLERDLTPSSEATVLKGDVTIEPEKAAILISEDFRSRIAALKIGPGYVLNGQWHILKVPADNFLDQLRFNGRLEGSQVVFKGYVWQRLIALANLRPGHIQLRDLRVEDSSGQFTMKTINMARQESGSWFCEIPSIQGTNYRPSLMQEAGSPSNIVGKPLLVKSLEIENMTGLLHDSSTWKGKGKLDFVNPNRKHVQNPIFAIPVEILSLFGLDIAALNPVSGTILYEVRDRKVMLTKFKDVYSEGKLSKFYLSNVSKTPSYMDFEGNLDVQIRMKQYNLLFKLAELFTVNISGTTTKPVYSLQRQSLNTRRGKK
ncbi:MAG: hypothetical protein LLG04_02455 [Parachlamydia sp.]|nr:hypothetical protein [Parachlamydia sp.]